MMLRMSTGQSRVRASVGEYFMDQEWAPTQGEGCPWFMRLVDSCLSCHCRPAIFEGAVRVRGMLSKFQQ
eukprot:7676821-Alexandrium_andersonii.AAC.1